MTKKRNPKGSSKGLIIAIVALILNLGLIAYIFVIEPMITVPVEVKEKSEPETNWGGYREDPFYVDDYQDTNVPELEIKFEAPSDGFIRIDFTTYLSNSPGGSIIYKIKLDSTAIFTSQTFITSAVDGKYVNTTAFCYNLEDGEDYKVDIAVNAGGAVSYDAGIYQATITVFFYEYS